MSRSSITPLQLFKALTLTLLYIIVSAAWLLFGVRTLISSSSDLNVATGFVGIGVWLIVTACLYLIITKPKPGQSANTTEKDQ